MFYNRLKWLAIAMSVVAVAILIRLVDIQVVRAAQFETLADRMLTRPVRYLPAPRGSILDRDGRLLVSDEPTSDVNVHYALLRLLAAEAQAGDEGGDEPRTLAGARGSDQAPESTALARVSGSDQIPDVTRRFLHALARSLRRADQIPREKPTEVVVEDLLEQIEESWSQLSRITGRPRAVMVENAATVCRRIERVREIVRANTPTIRAIREENELHPVLRNLPNDAALRVRERLERHPWIRVVPSSQRTAHEVDSLVHVIGRMGAAGPERIANDPLAGDELRGLRAGDRCGITGMERVAELELRGTRGYIREDLDGTIEAHVEPVRGNDVRLSIDSDLQRFSLERLKQAVDESEHPAGGSAVVIDARTREVLALVSYPVYSYERFSEDYAKLRGDARWQPLRFRAVANTYPPGSTCKVVGLYGAMADGIVDRNTTITCNGHFLPNLPNKFRCWIYNQYGSTHGPQTTEDAVRNSCNIFFYTVGDRLGASRLCEWFSRFGLGRLQGTGLIEESAGIVPTAAYLHRAQGRDYYPSDAWNYAIGQGEVTATPLQAANVAATIATGRWAPVRLVLDEPKSQLQRAQRAKSRESSANSVASVARSSGGVPPAIEFDEAYLRTIRTGMWRVVNEPGGTGHAARMEHANHVLCGKTGSAQAVPRPISRRWFLEWPDGRRETVTEPFDVQQDEILERFDDPKPKVAGWRTQERYPPIGPDEKLPSHAWFIGFTQARRTPQGGQARGKVLAISVIVEYGGSGGRVAGPVARDIAQHILDTQQEWGRAEPELRIAKVEERIRSSALEIGYSR